MEFDKLRKKPGILKKNLEKSEILIIFTCSAVKFQFDSKNLLSK